MKTYLRTLMETNYRDIEQILALYRDMPDEIMPSWFAEADPQTWQAAVDAGRVVRDEGGGWRVVGE